MIMNSMSGNKNHIIPFGYFGGKFTYLDELYSLFPHRNQYNHLCELFAGSSVVSLNHPRKDVARTVVEINSMVTNFFQVLRNQPYDLVELLHLTPFSQNEYVNCWEPAQNEIEAARRFFVRCRQSYRNLGSQGENPSFRLQLNQVYSGGGSEIRQYLNGIDGLLEIANSIQSRYQILNEDYRDAIKKLDNEKTFFYCDPPYVLSTRSGRRYIHEWEEKDHIELSENLNSIKGFAMVSGYDSDLYDRIFRDWKRTPLTRKKNNMASTDSQEVVWTNYEPKRQQLSLLESIHESFKTHK